MSLKIMERGPMRLPDSKFGVAFVSEDLTMRNPQIGNIFLITGDKKEGEVGISRVTIDAVDVDGAVVASKIPFLRKQQFPLYGYEEITEDVLNIAECPHWREYMVKSDALAKYDTNVIRFNVSAVENSTINCCMLIEGENLRYSGETHYDD